MLRTRPRTLLGSEMIFEITTSLQDILNHAAQDLVQSVPTLEEERVIQQAVLSSRLRRSKKKNENYSIRPVLKKNNIWPRW